METYKGEAIHGRPSLEGYIFPYQVCPTKCVFLSKMYWECKCDSMDMEQILLHFAHT